jgi:hypothetical protein
MKNVTILTYPTHSILATQTEVCATNVPLGKPGGDRVLPNLKNCLSLNIA